MTKRKVLATSIAFAFGAIATQAEAGAKCDLEGSYGYSYDGASYDASGAVGIAETGSFSIGSNSCGRGVDLCGTAMATFRFPNFNGAPLWALVKLEFRGLSGAVVVNPNDPCQGTVNFLAKGTVIKSSPSGFENAVLFIDQRRSIAYTVSGSKAEIVDLISTSPGSVLAGTAKAQDR